MANEIQSPASTVSVTFVGGTAVESPAPSTTHVNDGQTKGNPQVPAGARSIVANTSVGFANDNLAHVCDFVTDIQKNIERYI